MKIKGLEVKDPQKIMQPMYACPYCSKKFINRGSYYNHIDKKYCWNFYPDFERKTQEYKDKKITKKEYWTWCYENGYCEFLNLDDVTLEELGQELYDKIRYLYDYSDDYY